MKITWLQGGGVGVRDKFIFAKLGGGFEGVPERLHNL